MKNIKKFSKIPFLLLICHSYLNGYGSFSPITPAYGYPISHPILASYYCYNDISNKKDHQFQLVEENGNNTREAQLSQIFVSDCANKVSTLSCSQEDAKNFTFKRAARLKKKLKKRSRKSNKKNYTRNISKPSSLEHYPGAKNETYLVTPNPSDRFNSTTNFQSESSKKVFGNMIGSVKGILIIAGIVLGGIIGFLFVFLPTLLFLLTVIFQLLVLFRNSIYRQCRASIFFEIYNIPKRDSDQYDFDQKISYFVTYTRNVKSRISVKKIDSLAEMKNDTQNYIQLDSQSQKSLKNTEKIGCFHNVISSNQSKLTGVVKFYSFFNFSKSKILQSHPKSVLLEVNSVSYSFVDSIKTALLDFSDRRQINIFSVENDGFQRNVLKDRPIVFSSNENNCAICMEEYKAANQLYVLPCKHYFHAHCFTEYQKNYDVQCPVCRCSLAKACSEQLENAEV